MLRIEEVDSRHVPVGHQVDLQVTHEPGCRHPEIVPHQADGLEVLAVTLPQRRHQVGRRLAPMGEQPLLELVQDHEDLPVLG